MADVAMKLGQPSWRIAWGEAEAWVTEAGAMLGPVRFQLGARAVEPYHVAPWAEEDVPFDPILRGLRGDFLCLPFGGNASPLDGVSYALHGASANDAWQLEVHDGSSVALGLDRPEAAIRRKVTLGENWVAQQNSIDLRTSLPAGMHAMLRFRTPGLVSLSAFDLAATPPVPFETPAEGGYSWLDVDARFKDLAHAPGLDGKDVDVSRYPCLDGWENLAMAVRKASDSLGWSAVSFPEEGYVWFSVRRLRTLPHTVLWFSNGGRHYAPWNGRHRGVLGIEDVCAFFHLGAAESVEENWLSQTGYPTALESGMRRISTVSGVAAIPEGFGNVAEIEEAPQGIVIRSREGLTVRCEFDLALLD